MYIYLYFFEPETNGYFLIFVYSQPSLASFSFQNKVIDMILKRFIKVIMSILKTFIMAQLTLGTRSEYTPDRIPVHPNSRAVINISYYYILSHSNLSKNIYIFIIIRE